MREFLAAMNGSHKSPLGEELCQTDSFSGHQRAIYQLVKSPLNSLIYISYLSVEKFSFPTEAKIGCNPRPLGSYSKEWRNAWTSCQQLWGTVRTNRKGKRFWLIKQGEDGEMLKRLSCLEMDEYMQSWYATYHPLITLFWPSLNK